MILDMQYLMHSKMSLRFKPFRHQYAYSPFILSILLKNQELLQLLNISFIFVTLLSDSFDGKHSSG